jgi:hypothetical protein
MATINSIDVFPSIKEIGTDSNGDLQEILSADGSTASLVYDLGSGNGAEITAVAEGAVGNKLYFQITENSQAGVDQIDVRNHASVEGGKVLDIQFDKTLAMAVPGVSDSLVYNNNFTISRVATGAGSVQFHVIDEVDNGYATVASAVTTDVTFTKNVAGASSHTIQLTEGNGAPDAVSIVGNDITIALQNLAASSTSNDIITLFNNSALGADFTATLNAGKTGGEAQAVIAQTSFTGGADDQDEVKIHAVDDDISVCLVDNISNYTNAQIFALITDGTKAWATNFSGATAKFGLTVTNAATNASLAINGSFSLTGGADASGQTGTLLKIKELIDGSTEASELVTITLTGDNTTLPTALGETAFSGGLDATVSDLDPNSQYIMIKRDDIYELEAGESSDARKIVWGVLDKYTSHVTGLSVEQQPENFVVTRGTPALIIDNAGTRVRQAYSVQAFYATGDWDLENETSV